MHDAPLPMHHDRLMPCMLLKSSISFTLAFFLIYFSTGTQVSSGFWSDLGITHT
jgi:hypothetical protein